MNKSETHIKIGIIEDLKEVADSLKDTFNKEEDMSCSQVYYNAEDAITFLPKSPPDVVLVDIGLPGKSGVEAIVILREIMPLLNFACLPSSKMMRKFSKA